MTVSVHFRGGRQLARQTAYDLAAMLTGRAPDNLGLAAGVFTAVGFAALSDVKDDFVRKARGGVGEDGVQWQRLSRKYLAYQRRFGSGEKQALKAAAGLGRGNRLAPGGKKGLLTTAQLKRWRQIYGTRLSRFLLSMPEGAAKARAAQIAWATVKREGAQTMLDVYGNRQVEILRDTGVLLNSLSPGQIGGNGLATSYTKPSGPGGDEQIFHLFNSGVIVGTTVAYAAVHQHGNPSKGIPARPFLPDNIPPAWLNRWSDVAQQAIAVAARILFQQAA
jgi:hypothetical protein